MRNGHYLANFPGERSDDRHLHLHRFQHCELIPGRDSVAGFHGYGNDHGGRRRADHAAIVPVNAMQNAIHLDSVSRPLGYGDDVETPPEGGKPVFKLAEALDVGVDVRPILIDTVLLGPKPMGLEQVRVPAIAQLSYAAYVIRNLRAPTQRRRIELGLLQGEFGRVDFDRRVDQSDLCVSPREMLAGRRQIVQPCGVNFSPLDLRSTQQFK